MRHVVERGTTISLHSGAAEGDFVQSSQAPPEYGAMMRNRKIDQHETKNRGLEGPTWDMSLASVTCSSRKSVPSLPH